ncbi:MAG: PAS domain S-box protein [Deltaproteobacteria bacterium]|nr:PAS domain S-box protein [Deltaproteobacteria bacterium]
MKVTIRVKLAIGYAAILGFMIIVSILSYITINNINRSVRQILLVTYKYGVMDGLKDEVKKFVDASNSVILGQLHDVGYYQSIISDLDRRILYVEKLRLMEHEKAFLKNVKTEFDSIRKMTEQSLQWTSAMRNANLVAALKEMDKEKPILINSVEGLYDEAWRSMDAVTILADKNMKRGVWQIIVFSIIAIIAGIGISIYISQKIVTPIRALSVAASGVAKGDLSQAVKKASEDEVGELVASFNQMLVELKTSREQIEKYNKELKIMVEERTAELEKTKEYLENILEYSKEMIITATPFDEIVQFNKGAENILGYNKENMAGSNIEYLFVDKNEYKRMKKRAIEDGEIYEQETKLVKKGGDIAYINLTLSRLVDKNGNIIGLIGVGRDAADRTPRFPSF